MTSFEIDTAICVERINQAKYILKAIDAGEVSASISTIEEFWVEVTYLKALEAEISSWKNIGCFDA
tara:strand:+ start:43 stop:240 length:198 start_codon:yes stop_codon:yes gene_type:complete